MEDLNEYRALKQGKVTVKAVVDELAELANKGTIDKVVIVSRMTDGIIHTSFSDTTHIEALGLLEVGKVDVLNDMVEKEE